MRFCIQKGGKDCGPTALANAFRFLKLPNVDAIDFNDECNCTADGTWIIDMERAGRRLAQRHNFIFQKMASPTWAKMRRAMDDGWGLILAYNFIRTNGGHFVFISKNNEGYLTANDSMTDKFSGRLEHRYTPSEVWRARIRRGGIACFKVKAKRTTRGK